MACARCRTAESVSFTDATRSSFAVHGAYRSAPGSGDPARDFRDEWNLLVAPGRRQIGELKTETADWPGGWTLTASEPRTVLLPFAALKLAAELAIAVFAERRRDPAAAVGTAPLSPRNPEASR